MPSTCCNSTSAVARGLSTSWRSRYRVACTSTSEGRISAGRRGRAVAAQLLRAFLREQRVDELVEVAVEHRLQLVRRDADAMVGHAVLREVVGPDLLGALPRSDLFPSGLGLLLVLTVLRLLQQSRTEVPHGLLLVLEL